MARQRVHQSAAGRQRAYRQRRAAQAAQGGDFAPPGAMGRGLRFAGRVGRSVGAVLAEDGEGAVVGGVFGHVLAPGLAVRVLAVEDGGRVWGEVIEAGAGRLARGQRGPFRAEYLAEMEVGS